MNKVIISSLFILILTGCKKDLGDLTFSEAIPGGCASGKGISSGKSNASETDKVTYITLNGNLELTFGFSAACCGQYSTTSVIEGDTIIIKVVTTQAGQCNCICYYTYDFKFTGTGKNYKYNVSLDDAQTFTGVINP